jgi:hypothetical protein
MFIATQPPKMKPQSDCPLSTSTHHFFQSSQHSGSSSQVLSFKDKEIAKLKKKVATLCVSKEADIVIVH